MNTTPHPPLGIAHLCLLDCRPDKVIEIAAHSGFAQVGLRLIPPHPGALTYHLSNPELLHLKRLMSDTGVTVNDIEFISIDDTFSPTSLKSTFEQAAELGARRITVGSDTPDKERFCRNLYTLCEMAKPLGLVIDLENMPWRRPVATFNQAIDVALSVNQPNCGVVLDALHFFRGGNTPNELLQKHCDIIHSVQICDASSPPPRTAEALQFEARNRRMAPGEGTLPLIDLLRALRDNPTLSVEAPKPNRFTPQEWAQHLKKCSLNTLETARRLPINPHAPPRALKS